MYECHCSEVGSLSSVSAGRIRGSILPVEYEFSQFIDNISNPPYSWSTQTPGCSWFGVVCFQNRVERLQWAGLRLKGNLLWRFLPPSLTIIDLGRYVRLDNELSGELEFNYFPSVLEYAYLDHNKFSGSLDLGHLPQSLLYLTVAYNAFQGEVEFGVLPPNIERLYLQGNDISGMIRADDLPASLITISLQMTRIQMT